MTQQFKPGDRVLREVVIDRDPGGENVLVQSPSVNGGWLAWVKRGSLIPLPTPASHLRAAADIVWWRGFPRLAEALRSHASRIEAARAPKPTLREAAVALLARWPSDQHDGSPLKDEADALREALAREEGASS